MTDRKGNSLSPEPCALIPYRPKAASMTSGRGSAELAPASAGLMDGRFAAMLGGGR